MIWVCGKSISEQPIYLFVCTQETIHSKIKMETINLSANKLLILTTISEQTIHLENQMDAAFW